MPTPIIIADLRGGRNDTDDPMALPMTQCVEALNVDWQEGLLAHRRMGSDAVAESGGTAFSSGIQSLFRHVPGGSEAAAELWGIDGAGTPIVKRMTGGTSFANVTLDDAISTNPKDVVAATLNSKLFLAYDSSVDRLHVYDPGLSSPRVRRVGINPGTNAPTVADTGAGAYAAVIRYYRVRFQQLDGSNNVIRRSEPTPVVTFTPSGGGTAARITRPTAPGEGETHWYVEGSADNLSFFILDTSTTVIATTTFDDSTAPSGYASATGNAPTELPGLYALFPSVKYVVADGNRVLGGGSWEASGATSGGKNSRIWFTPVLGSSDRADDERIPNTTAQKNWVDLNENDGGFLTGLGGPLDGAIWAFKYRQVWRLAPTGDVSVPYLPKKRSDGIGCIAHKTIVSGEDEAGRPALYWMSHRGPYRVGANGIQYLGRDNEVLWATMNQAATGVVAHATWYPDIHQVWFNVATGSANDPDVRMVFDVLLGRPDDHNQVRGGWAKHTGDSCEARCSTLFSNTLGASMSRDLKPYIGRSGGTAIQKCNSTAQNDAGTAFAASITTRPILTVGDLDHFVGVGQSILLAKVASGVTIRQSLIRDFGLETRTSDVLLTAAASETRVVRKFESSELAQATIVQVKIGDVIAGSLTWTLDALTLPLHSQGVR